MAKYTSFVIILSILTMSSVLLPPKQPQTMFYSWPLHCFIVRSLTILQTNIPLFEPKIWNFDLWFPVFSSFHQKSIIQVALPTVFFILILGPQKCFLWLFYHQSCFHQLPLHCCDRYWIFSGTIHIIFNFWGS